MAHEPDVQIKIRGRAAAQIQEYMAANPPFAFMSLSAFVTMAAMEKISPAKQKDVGLLNREELELALRRRRKGGIP